MLLQSRSEESCCPRNVEFWMGIEQVTATSFVAAAPGCCGKTVCEVVGEFGFVCVPSDKATVSLLSPRRQWSLSHKTTAGRFLGAVRGGTVAAERADYVESQLHTTLSTLYLLVAG